MIKKQQLHRFQEFLQNTKLVILDEVSMVGRQMMGRINSRFDQGKAENNENGETLGGISMVCVGDPAQCEAISDQQLYDKKPHPDTSKDASASKVRLSNVGMEIYEDFKDVIVLTTCHRLKTIANPITDEDKAYNDRADQCLRTLHRLRDVNWTIEDYLWICKRKKSKLSLSEKMQFRDAPRIMDFRKESDANPEQNCEYYNKCQLRAHARERDVPVLRFPSLHEGISQEDGLKLDDVKFNDLPSYLEIAEDAKILLTMNLDVEHGLLNGSQGTVKGWVYKKGNHPNHDDLSCRSPEYIIVDIPKYDGPSFYDVTKYPERSTWIPLSMKRIPDATNKNIYRCQFPIVLAWALTPWKAQGMTLEKAVIHIGNAACKPGVLFVALSRVKHVDDLMLEDDFPALATIIAQRNSKGYEEHQIWEREARVKFSKTIRRYMKDTSIYSADKCWTDEDNDLCELILQSIREDPHLTEHTIFNELHKDKNKEDLIRVWEKLQTFPHIFEIASARKQLLDYELNGILKPVTHKETRVTHLELQQWKVTTNAIEHFCATQFMTTALMEFLCKIARCNLSNNITLHNVYKCKSLHKIKIEPCQDTWHIFFLESVSQHWALFALHFDMNTELVTKMHLFVPNHVESHSLDFCLRTFNYKI